MMRDVIVVGGGTSGFIAAVAAARSGARTLLLEQAGYLGGTMTGGLVPGMVSMRHQPWKNVETIVGLENSYDGDQVTRGIAQEFIDRLIAEGGAFGSPGKSTVRVMFDPEIMKWVMNAMVIEAGAEIRFHSKVSELFKEGNSVTGVKTYSGDEYFAKVVVDTTGDGDVAALAGADYEVGEGGDPRYIQPMSFYFVMGDVDFEKIIEYLETGPEPYSAEYVRRARSLKSAGKPFSLRGFPTLIKKALEAGDYPIPYGTDTVNPEAHIGLIRPAFRDGKTRYNISMHNIDMAYHVDPTDNAQLSEAMVAMREFTVRIARFFRKYVPGFEDAYLLQTADLVGIRESRRIKGDYTLTKDDVLQRREFHDAVGYCGAAVDVHNEEGGRARTKMIAIEKSGAYQVPYRILLPAGLNGILIAGRPVSTDRIANVSIRQQAGCFVTGQAAGLAASIAAQDDVQPRDIRIEKLQDLLMGQGAILRL